MVTHQQLASAKHRRCLVKKKFDEILTKEKLLEKFLRKKDYLQITMSLSLIQSLRVGTVLEDCSHQLDILEHCLTVQIRKEHGSTPVQEEKRLIKLKSDCQFISQQMSQLSFELEDKQSFSSLLKAVEKTEKKKINTQTDLEQTKQMELRQQKILDKQDELNKLTPLCKELRDKVMKKKLENLMLGLDDEEDFMDEMIQQTKTRKAETKQTEHPQNEIQDQLKLLQTQLTEEKRAHEEAMKFLQNRHKALQQQLNSWKQQSKEMLQDKQKQVHTVKRKRTLNLDKLMEMKRKIKEMEQVVMEDMKEKERLLQREAEIRAATKLQAWWRGCMVRKGLGASKKAKDKKTKKKKGKKKK